MVGVPATITECEDLARWAQTQPRTIPDPIDPEQMGRHLRFMATALPSQSVSAEVGKARFAVYLSILRELTEAQMDYVAREACKRCRWFPTPSECLEIAAEFPATADGRADTLKLCSDTMQALMERFVAEPDLAQDVPDQWRRIAIERGTLRRLEDGSLVIRCSYHGPLLAYAGAQ